MTMIKFKTIIISLNIFIILPISSQVNMYDKYQPTRVPTYGPRIYSRPQYQPVKGYSIKDYTEDDAMIYFDYNNLDPIEGIWQSTDGFKYSIEKNVENSIRVSGKYRMLVLNSNIYEWKTGEIKAFIKLNANGIFSLDYYTSDGYNKYLQSCIGFLENAMSFSFTRNDNDNKIGLAKLYPDEVTKKREREEEEKQEIFEKEKAIRERKEKEKNAVSSGTGFALSSNGYIVTNYHVINNAKSIDVRGVNGNLSKKLSAIIVASDKENDLAIIKINDVSFTSLGTIPYTFRIGIADIGESVFTLGYPLTQIMGEEIKLTNGIINSRTGFQGSTTYYQISAQIQPGNSGGPLFDKYGNVIGVTSSGIKRELNLTENVNYAVKIRYLLKLAETFPNKTSFNQKNLLTGKSLSEQAKFASKFTYIILINDNNQQIDK